MADGRYVVNRRYVCAPPSPVVDRGSRRCPSGLHRLTTEETRECCLQSLVSCEATEANRAHETKDVSEGVRYHTISYLVSSKNNLKSDSELSPRS